jgi:hypothetical protein
MAQISRSTKVSGGTTLSANTLARAADVETDVLTLFNAHNNHDTGTSKWTVVSSFGASSVPLIADNSSGTQDIAQFKDNGTTVWSIADGGNLVSNSKKITGLAAATANGDAIRYEQVNTFRVLSVNTTALSSQDSVDNTAFTAFANLQATVTPVSSSSRFIILVTGAATDSTTDQCFHTILRGSTNIGHASSGLTEYNVTTSGPIAYHVYDSPATASAITYKAAAKRAVGTAIARLNTGTTLTVVEIG